MSARVFVLETSSLRNEAIPLLEGRGKITPIFPGRQPALFKDEYQDAIRLSLISLQFNPAADYVAITSTIVSAVILTAILVEEFGEFNALLFDSRHCDYECKRLPHMA